MVKIISQVLKPKVYKLILYYGSIDCTIGALYCNVWYIYGSNPKTK